MSEVLVFTTPTDALTASLIEQYTWMLTPEEAERHRRLRHPGRRIEDVVARALTRAVLARVSGVAPSTIELVRSPRGRPEIQGPPAAAEWSFSLAHCAGMVAIAVTRDGTVGIDVEPAAGPADAMEIAPFFMAPPELRDLAATPTIRRASRFIEYWTVKEAYLKALGMGLLREPREVCVDLDPIPRLRFGGPQAHLRHSAVAPGHRIAVALLGSSMGEVRIVERELVPFAAST